MTELARRVIRSSGNGSGSVEVTLPACFRVLEGTACRVLLRDGLRPEIVLEPDLSPARLVLERLYRRLAEACGADAAGGFSPADLTLALMAPPAGAPLPALAYLDALALARPAPHRADALGRVVVALAAAIAPRLGIGAALAPDFAAAAGFALSGIVADTARQLAADLAGAELAALETAPGQGFLAAGEDALAERFWIAAAPALARLAGLYSRLTDDPGQQQALAAAWRRGVALELSGGF